MGGRSSGSGGMGARVSESEQYVEIINNNRVFKDGDDWRVESDDGSWVGYELYDSKQEAMEAARQSNTSPDDDDGDEEEGPYRTVTSAQIRAVERTGFTNAGNGQWTIETPLGGAQILDETGGRRDPAHGMGGKVYSVVAWDNEFNFLWVPELFDNLNGAKRAAKNAIIKGM